MPSRYISRPELLEENTELTYIIECLLNYLWEQYNECNSDASEIVEYMEKIYSDKK